LLLGLLEKEIDPQDISYSASIIAWEKGEQWQNLNMPALLLENSEKGACVCAFVCNCMHVCVCV